MVDIKLTGNLRKEHLDKKPNVKIYFFTQSNTYEHKLIRKNINKPFGVTSFNSGEGKKGYYELPINRSPAKRTVIT